jgi:predicted DNA-binding transcriptional regulator YafY
MLSKNDNISKNQNKMNRWSEGKFKMGDKTNQIAFALEIIKLLAEKPYKREDLGSALSIFLEDQGKSIEDMDQKLSRTIKKLRDCGFDIRSAPNSPYELQHSNFPVLLAAEQREALAMAAYFLADMGFSAQASLILQIGNLAQPTQPSQVRVNFSPPVDYSEEHLETVVAKLQERFRQRRRYVIRYRSSSIQEQTWDLDRSELRLHNGVLYLFAHAPELSIRHHLTDRNRMLRVDRILSVGATSQTPWGILQFPSLQIRYRMSGSLSTYIPRRTHEQVIDRNLEAGFVEIAAQEDYVFGFRQRILQYGSNVRLLEPDWLVEQIAQELRKASQNYWSP